MLLERTAETAQLEGLVRPEFGLADEEVEIVRQTGERNADGHFNPFLDDLFDRLFDDLLDDLFDHLRLTDGSGHVVGGRAAAEAARAAARATEENIYFIIGRSNIRDCETPKIENIVNIMKTYPEAVVSVTGYADKATGTAKINWALSQKRAENVAKALVDAGIDADRISTNFYGDTKQVSDVPAENRVSVCVTR